MAIQGLDKIPSELMQVWGHYTRLRQEIRCRQRVVGAGPPPPGRGIILSLSKDGGGAP